MFGCVKFQTVNENVELYKVGLRFPVRRCRILAWDLERGFRDKARNRRAMERVTEELRKGSK